MKTLQFIPVILVALVGTSCSSTNRSSTSNADDVYYSTKDVNTQQPAKSQPASSSGSDYSTGTNSREDNSTQAPAESSAQSNQNSSQQNADYYDQDKSGSGTGNTYVTNNYYSDDYYDYAYTSRLRRFYTPVYGYNYYDPFYTNLYWYDYNPYSWGVSIYLGYHWWAPSYYYSMSFCYGGGYDLWYSPYYGSYGMGYWNGYNQGHYDGYYQGTYVYNPYYYNSYDASSYYYGHRGSSGGNSRINSSSRNSTLTEGRAPKSIGDKYVEAVSTGKINTIIKSSSIDNQNIKGNTSRSTDKNNQGTSNPSSVTGGIKGSGDKKNDDSKNPYMNGEIPIGGNPPIKGIITDKNEKGRSSENQQNNSNPVFPNPVKNNPSIGNDSRGNNVGDRTNSVPRSNPKGDNYGRQNQGQIIKEQTPPFTNESDNGNLPNDRRIKTGNDVPRNNQINNNLPSRNDQNNSRQQEIPRNNDRPKNNNQQSSPRKKEPGWPGQMSYMEHDQKNAPQVSPRSERDYSPSRSGSGNPSSGSQIREGSHNSSKGRK